MKNNWNELKDIKAPQELKERTLAAAREARKLTNEPLHAVPRHPWGMAKRLLAAACAFGIVLGGTAVYRTHNGTAQTGSAAVADAINHTFGFAAYAADTGELRQPKDSKIVFDTGSGADDPEKGFYSGCLFKVTGENIKTISATIDKGAVYRTKTVKDTSDNRDEWVRSMYQGTNPELDGADTVMVWGNIPEEGEEGADQMYADLCWKLDNGFTDAYDPDVSYGLWLPSQPLSEDDDLQDSWHAAVDSFEGAKLTTSQPQSADDDLQDSWHAVVDRFEGATLTVTITFTDDSEQTRSMTLHTGKLGVEYKDDTSGPSLTGEVLTDEQAAAEGYIYGVYADIE